MESSGAQGALDVAYAMPEVSARFRTNIFHSRSKYAIVMRRIITKIPVFDDLSLPPAVEGWPTITGAS